MLHEVLTPSQAVGRRLDLDGTRRLRDWVDKVQVAEAPAGNDEEHEEKDQKNSNEYFHEWLSEKYTQPPRAETD